jgi:hypothetical protein
MAQPPALYWQSLICRAYRGALWRWCIKPHSRESGGRVRLRQDLTGPTPAHAKAGQPQCAPDRLGLSLGVSQATCDEGRFVSG